jgi:hypothetical protein
MGQQAMSLPARSDIAWTSRDRGWRRRRHGPASVAEYLRSSREMWADLVSEASAVRRGDDIVIVHHVSGRMTDGSTRDMTVADVFTVRDGQVVKMRAYADRRRRSAPPLTAPSGALLPDGTQQRPGDTGVRLSPTAIAWWPRRFILIRHDHVMRPDCVALMTCTMRPIVRP